MDGTPTARGAVWDAAVVRARTRDVTLRLDGRPVVVAHSTRSRWARVRGLLFRRPLIAGEGVLLLSCSAVHTWLARGPIDVVHLDADLRVTKVAAGLRRWRITRGAPGTRHTLELAAGEAARIGIAPGAQLTPPGAGARTAEASGTIDPRAPARRSGGPSARHA